MTGKELCVIWSGLVLVGLESPHILCGPHSIVLQPELQLRSHSSQERIYPALQLDSISTSVMGPGIRSSTSVDTESHVTAALLRKIGRDLTVAEEPP